MADFSFSKTEAKQASADQSRPSQQKLLDETEHSSFFVTRDGTWLSDGSTIFLLGVIVS